MSSTSTSKDLQIRALLNTVVRSGVAEDCLTFIVNQLTEDEKSRFGETLLRKLLHPSESNLHCIDDDTVQSLLGYELKHHFVRFFKKHVQPPEYEVVTQLGDHSGHNIQKYMFTIDTVKKLSMLAATDGGRRARAYYMKLEDMIMTFGLQNIDRLTKRIEDRWRPDRLSGRTPGEFVYVFTDSHGTKVGKTTNLHKRQKNYSVMNPDGTFAHRIPCLNASILERSAHYILDQYHIERNKEWLTCDDQTALAAVTASQVLLDGLAGHAEKLVEFDIVGKLRSLMKDYHQFCGKPATKAILPHQQAEPKRPFVSIPPYKTPNQPTKDQAVIAGPSGLQRQTQLPDWSASRNYGTAATVFERGDITEEDMVHALSFRALRQTANDPHDFDKFVRDCFILDAQSQVMNTQISSVYRFWSGNQDKTQRDTMLAWFKARYREGRAAFDPVMGGNKTVLFGLRLRPIVYDRTQHDNEYDTFIAENFIIDCSGRVLMTRLQSAYLHWKETRGDPIQGKARAWKDPLHSYMADRFMYNTQTWMGDEGGQQMGYIGLSFPNELVGVGIHPHKERNERPIVLRCEETQEVISVFPSQGAAAAFVNRVPSLISTRLKDGKPIKRDGADNGKGYTVHRWETLTGKDIENLQGDERKVIERALEAKRLAAASDRKKLEKRSSEQNDDAYPSKRQSPDST